MRKPFWMRDPRTWKVATNLGSGEYLLIMLVAVAVGAVNWGNALGVTLMVVLAATATASRVATIRHRKESR